MTIVPLESIPTLQTTQPIGEPQVQPVAGLEGSSFASIMRDALDTLQAAQEATKADSYDLAMGDITSLHSMMINSTMEATAVETVVQLTSRAVSAYKEIMQMQI